MVMLLPGKYQNGGAFCILNTGLKVMFIVVVMLPNSGLGAGISWGMRAVSDRFSHCVNCL